MGVQEIFAIVFIICLLIFLVLKRKSFDFKSFLFPLFYIALYKTKIGLKLMDSIAKKLNKLSKPICYIIIFIGFAGMILLLIELAKGAMDLILNKGAAGPGVEIIQPFFPNIPGTIFVPFFYFLISLCVIATVHEFAHGTIARLHKIKVKSSGFAIAGIILPIIPAAFVEPDEKQLIKRPALQQISLFAAGPVANIVTALLVLIVISLVVAPVSNAMFELEGMKIKSLSKDGPAEEAGLLQGEIIRSVDGNKIEKSTDFQEILAKKKPGELAEIGTNTKTYLIELDSNPGDAEKAFLGVVVRPETEYKPSFTQTYGKLSADILSWIFKLFFWLFILNLGIGLFNLIPIGPLDGGRMILALCQKHFSPEKALSIMASISLCVLTLLFFMIFSPFFF